MPYAFKDIDEKCNFLCVCLKSATENGGKVDTTSVANTLNYPKKKVTTFLSTVKKAGDALFNSDGANVTVENDNEATSTEDAENPKKRKVHGTGKSKKEALPKAKKVKVEEDSEAIEEAGEGDDRGDAEAA